MTKHEPISQSAEKHHRLPVETLDELAPYLHSELSDGRLLLLAGLGFAPTLTTLRSRDVDGIGKTRVQLLKVHSCLELLGKPRKVFFLPAECQLSHLRCSCCHLWWRENTAVGRCRDTAKILQQYAGEYWRNTAISGVLKL